MVKWPSPKFWGGRLTQTNTFLKVYTKILNFLKVLGWSHSGQPSDYTPDRENRGFNTLKSKLLWDYVIVLNKFSWILLCQKFVNISAHNTLNYHILLLKICPGRFAYHKLRLFGPLGKKVVNVIATWVESTCGFFWRLQKKLGCVCVLHSPFKVWVLNIHIGYNLEYKLGISMYKPEK